MSRKTTTYERGLGGGFPVNRLWVALSKTFEKVMPGFSQTPATPIPVLVLERAGQVAVAAEFIALPERKFRDN